MLISELKKRLQDLPDDTYIYLDDHAMPTPLALVNVEFSICNGFQIARGEDGRIERETSVPIKLNVATLTTYLTPAGGWEVDMIIRQSKKKKSKESKKKK